MENRCRTLLQMRRQQLLILLSRLPTRPPTLSPSTSRFTKFAITISVITIVRPHTLSHWTPIRSSPPCGRSHRNSTIPLIIILPSLTEWHPLDHDNPQHIHRHHHLHHHHQVDGMAVGLLILGLFTRLLRLDTPKNVVWVSTAATTTTTTTTIDFDFIKNVDKYDAGLTRCTMGSTRRSTSRTLSSSTPTHPLAKCS